MRQEICTSTKSVSAANKSVLCNQFFKDPTLHLQAYSDIRQERVDLCGFHIGAVLMGQNNFCTQANKVYGIYSRP